MEVEKRGSRGGFFHMFDWNRKSRKKLFLNNSELFGNFLFLLILILILNMFVWFSSFMGRLHLGVGQCQT